MNSKSYYTVFKKVTLYLSIQYQPLRDPFLTRLQLWALDSTLIVCYVLLFHNGCCKHMIWCFINTTIQHLFKAENEPTDSASRHLNHRVEPRFIHEKLYKWKIYSSIILRYALRVWPSNTSSYTDECIQQLLKSIMHFLMYIRRKGVYPPCWTDQWQRWFQ